nr:probable E3 ubiquitin-protein ligase HECTD4 isoform X1 [Danio rerio]|eukprot:XP_021324857.1 probable E3 ubiquitin-protein ligase HECTD4 isoform X1 [Danio rerio]
MDSELLIQPKSVSPPPGAVLVLHSLLLEFPLAMVFTEQLLTYSVGETIERSEDELDTVPTSVLIQVVELPVPEEKFLTLEVFHKFTLDRAKQDIRSVWRAILACGYDLHFDRQKPRSIDSRHAQKASRKWSFEMDFALVQFVNRLSRHLAITPARLHPHEVYLVASKNGADPEVSQWRVCVCYQNSIGTLLCEAKGSCCAVKVLWRVCTAAWPSSTSLPPRVLTHSHTSSTSLQCVTSHLNICSSCPISC